MCIEYGVSFSLSFSLSLWHWARNKIVKITASQPARVKQNTREHVVTQPHTQSHRRRKLCNWNFWMHKPCCTNKIEFSNAKKEHPFLSFSCP
jgi:hypothetical protein